METDMNWLGIDEFFRGVRGPDRGAKEEPDP